MAEYKYQYHVYKNNILTPTAPATGIVQQFSVRADVLFPVKEIRFDFSYAINADSDVNYIITSDVTNADIVGVINKLIYASGGTYWSVDGLSKDKEFKYIFREPLIINGNINFNILNIGVEAITSANILTHLEFLG